MSEAPAESQSDIDVAQFRGRVRVILRKADLNNITAKAVRTQIEAENDVDLSGVRKKFDALVLEVLDEVLGGDAPVKVETEVKTTKTSTPPQKEEKPRPSTKEARPTPAPSAPSSIGGPGRKKAIMSEEFVEDSDLDSDDESRPRKSSQPVAYSNKAGRSQPMTDEELARLLQKEETGLRSRSGKRKAAPSAGASVAKRAKGGGDGAPKRGGGGFSQPYILSEELSAVCGGEKELPRGQVVKRLWAYIKGNSLQDPNNGRSILCDDALKAVFGKSKVDAFGMNKLLSNHLSKPGDLGGDVADSDDDDGSDGDASDGDSEHGQAPKRASSSRKPAKNGKAKPAAGGGKGGGGWNAPQLLSPELRSVIAETVDSEVQTMARPTVVKHLWIYIRAKGLQDPADKRDILTDDKLKAVFSQRRVVTMFQMNKLLKDHLKRVPVDMDAATAKWEDVYGKTGDDRPRKTKSAGSDSDESSSAESSSEEE